MSEPYKQSAQRSANIIAGLSQERQISIGKNLAVLIDIAMDAAEQIAPMLAANKTNSAGIEAKE